MTSRSEGFYRRHGKRLVDVVFASALLLLAAPLMLLITLVTALTIGRPILFRQQRPGRGGRPFVLTKFRTMREPGEAAESDAVRLTGWGRFLRATSLDELPELVSVVRGEMSLVGPRPLLMEYLELYSPEQNRRHEARPGLTGWAQVNGRNAVGWQERFAYDVWYVDHCSLALDLKILAMTLGQVVRGRGIRAPEHATMPRFTGNKND